MPPSTASPPHADAPGSARRGPLALFALSASAEFGAGVAAALNEPLAPLEERDFEDGEHKARPLESVEGADAFVIHGLYGGPGQSANDKLCRLVFFMGALRDAGAARVTAVTPYLCYARKDRRTKPFDPVNTRYVAAMMESVGLDAVITLDVHNPAAFENAFRCRAIALTAAPLVVDYVKGLDAQELAVISPDPGGAKRAELVREALEAELGRPVGKALADKHRSAGVVSGELFAGSVAGATALIVDDLISTGTTLVRTARAAREAGAARVIAFATHGLFMEGAAEALADPAIDRLVVTDAVPAFRLPAGAVRDKTDILPAAPLIAGAIRRIREGRALTDLYVF